jgi:hypothetical protein
VGEADLGVRSAGSLQGSSSFDERVEQAKFRLEGLPAITQNHHAVNRFSLAVGAANCRVFSE